MDVRTKSVEKDYSWGFRVSLCMYSVRKKVCMSFKLFMPNILGSRPGDLGLLFKVVFSNECIRGVAEIIVWVSEVFCPLMIG